MHSSRCPGNAEAEQKLKEHVLPFFEEVVRKHGHSAPAGDDSPSNRERQS